MIRGFKAHVTNIPVPDPLNPPKSEQSFNVDLNKAIEWGRKYIESNPTAVVRIDELTYCNCGNVLMDPITKSPLFFPTPKESPQPCPLPDPKTP